MKEVTCRLKKFYFDREESRKEPKVIAVLESLDDEAEYEVSFSSKDFENTFKKKMFKEVIKDLAVNTYEINVCEGGYITRMEQVEKQKIKQDIVRIVNIIKSRSLKKEK